MKLPNTLKRCMGAWRHDLRLTVAAAAGLAAFTSTADAAKVVWQSSVDSPAGQEFIDLLEAAGHEVTVLNTGTPSADQIAMINAHDLIIFSRKNASGNFEGGANQFWDTDITIPAMAMSAYIVRDNRLQWVQGNDVPDDTPAEVNVDTGHPVWVCVEPGPWHTAVDRGTTFNINALVEPGVLIASATGEGDTTEAIVAEWPSGTIAAGPRMLFNAGARELAGAPIDDAGAYNLTATGEVAFLNAVAYMAYLSGNVQPPSGSTVYHQDFTAADGTTDLADGSTISSNNAVAEVEANALVMTRDGTTSSLTGYVLPTLPDLSNGFVATFDFALSGGGDRPADGFSFNFGDLSTSTPEGNGEEGFAGATNDLRVEFDTWNNDGTEPEGFNGIGFDIEVGADNLARCRIPLDSTAWNNNAAFRFNGQPRPAWIVWQDGLLDFWVDGVPIFTGVDTGAWAPNGNIGFSARTGGATETLVIDNVHIAACTTISTVSEFGLGGDAPAVINTTGFGDDALTFSDRTHEHNAAQFNDSGTLAVDGANTVPLPDYLVGNQYVQFANDARDQGDYFATVTASHPTSWYLLVDNRANGPAGDTSSPNTSDPVLGGNLQWVLDGGWQRVNTGISPNGQADYTGVDEGGNGGLNQFYSVYTLPYPTNSVTVRNIGASGNMISLVAAKGFDGVAGDPGPLLLDFGSSGPNANGSATGWTAVNNLVQDVPFSIWPGITITALEDGFNPNNTAAPGTGATFDYVDVPQNVFDDYLFKINDTAGTSAVMRIDGLPAATYSVTVFEGRTTDANQVGKIWVGDEPADENTGNFAGGGSTVIVEVGAGESLFYRHLEDNSGGISGMIIQRATSVPFGLVASRFTGGDADEGLDLDGDFLYAINMLGAGVTIRDAVFTMDDVAGFTHEFPNMAANWFPGVAYGDTTNDDNLEAIIRDIRWAGGADTPVDMTLANLVPGQTYQLQMLFGEACCNRGWDILFDGNPGLERFNVQQLQGGSGNPGVGVVVTYSFIPRAEVLTITFQQSSPGFPDNNPIIQGLTLETITDTDGDGLDDAIETALFGDLSQTADGDFDDDGLTNYQEIVRGTDATMDADADGDGLTDAQEILVYGTDPKNADSDNDGLSDGDEIDTHGTNPALADTDGDRLSDGDEVNLHGSNPLLVDTDNDGVPDGAEVAMGTDPANPAEKPLYLTSFTGGDSGEGLDLDGNFIYAINMRGPGDLQVRDALFTDDTVEGFTYDQPNEILAWHAPNYGSTANDDNLEVVMQSIRWNAGPVAMTLSGLTPGNTYKLQLLFAENCCDRGWDIAVEGETIVDDFNVPLLQGGIANPTRGAAVVYQFVAMDDTLEINFVNDAPAYPDNNPILNGLTLEDVPPSALDSLVIHYEFEQAPSDVVENTAEGTGAVLADSLAGWVGTDEQGANGWTYGYRQLPGDGSGAVDYDPSTDFIPFPASWWNGSAWDEPNVDTDNVPWTTVAQNSSHPNGPNSTDATPDALDPAPASGNYEHWAIRRWVSDYEGTVKIAYSVAKQNVGCGNGITGAIHINGVRQSSSVVAFDDGIGTTTYVEADLVAGDVVDLIHSPVGTDDVSADSCDGGLLSMTISTPASAPPGTLLRIDPTAAFVTGTDSPSLGGGGAMYFNESTGGGAGSYIDTNSLFSELGVFDESYTMMAWVRQSEIGGDKMIFGQTTAPALHNGARDNDYYMAHWGDDLNAGTGEVPSHLNEWTHLAFVYDGNQTIYVNGDPIAARDANNLQLDENLLIGNTVIAEDRDFSGWLDDVRVYSAALSQAEIQAVAGIEFADALKVHYAFEEGSGSSVVNSAVGQTDGTFLRGGSVEDNLVSDQNSPSGGNAMFFNTGTGDGAGSYIDTGLTPSSANVAGAYTMMAWAKQTEQDGDKMIFGQPSGEALHLGGRDTTYLQGHWGDDNQTGGGAVDLNQWTHLAFIYDGDTQTILKNGEVIAQRSGAGDIKQDTALLVGLAQVAENRDFSGYLDDVRIYCEALPFDAVNAIVGFGEDADGDGMEDIWERINFGTTDRNGTGDADADRVNDAAEFANGTDPNSRDTDGDQLWDGTELYATYTNPLSTDSDGDGLDDRFEFFAIGTDPNSDDTDRDGVTDGAELAAATITYDFNADPGAALTLMGNAEWRATGGVGDSGYLALTDAANSQNGIVTFADTTGGGAVTAIDFQADLRIGDGTCCGDPAGSQPADGMSINFVPAGTTPTFPNANEEGAAEGLAIAFDAWDSGAELDPLGPSITVRYNGSVVTEFDTNTMNGSVTDPTSIQTGPLGGLDWARVRVTLSPDGAITVTWKGVTIIDSVQTPYVPEPLQIVMAARTGGANENHHVDNVAVALLQDGTPNPLVFNEYDVASFKKVDYDFEPPHSTVIENAGNAGPGLLVLPEGADPSEQFMDGQLVLAGIATNDPNAVYVDTQNTSDALGVNGSNARYTMFARVRPDSVAGDNMIFGQLGGDALHNGLRGNQVHFGHWGSDSNSGSTTVTTGEWYDLAYRFDGTIQSIFVNGEKVSSSVQPRGLNNPMNVIIGGSREDSAFEGAIEGVQIYCEAFSDDVVVELQGFGEPASDELLIHYEFEDGITPVVRNLGNKGAPDGTVSAQNLIGAFAIGSPSKGGPGTMFFDSTNGSPGETIISTGLTPADAGILAQPYTMMAWAQPIQQAGGDRMIFGQANGDTGQALHNGIRDGRQHMGHWGDDLNATSVTVNWNTWEHYAYVWDGTDMIIYVNGEERAREAHGGLDNSATELIIGAVLPDTEDRDFIGYLDDVRIYCGVLGAAEIASVAGIEDTDGDGLIDAFERAYFGSDLSVADAGGDFDGDGISNGDEIAQGLNPALADTDGDCWPDNLELAYDTDPRDASDFPDIFAESDSPTAVWNIRTVQITEAAGDINNLATVDMVLNGELEILADGTQTSKVINISDGSYGNFQPDETIEAFDAVGDDHVTHVTGYFYMNVPGVITFNSATDDGARLRIDGVDVIVDDVLHGTRNSIENGLPGTIELAAGLHQLDYVVWERGGGYSAELSVPLIVGAFPTFASSPCGWELIPPVDPAEFSTEVVISGNFVANRDGAAEGSVMGPAETTGVIPASNWNNLGPAASQAPMVFDLDFNADPAAFVTFGGTGGAEWRATGGVDDSGYIAITDAVNGLNNTVTFADGTAGATAHSIEFSADLRIGDGTCCDGRLADGMSINFVPLGSTPTFEGGAGENGTEQGLAVYFDAWDNDDAGAADVVAIGVKYNNVVVAEFPTLTPNGAVDDPTSLQTGPLGEIGWAPVGISLKPDGTISVDWKGTRIIDGVQTGYEPGPVQLVLGARTGGANENHHIDNINVAIGTTPVLVDSSGGGTPVQVSWAANTIWTTFNPPADNAAAHMMNGYIDDTADGDDVDPYSHIAFDGIPYPIYDIYVYFTSDGNERTGEARMNGEEAVFLSTNGSNDPIVFDKATGADEASANPATYAVWRGLTGSSALFEWRRISNNVGVAGFQIVGQRDLPVPGLLAYWNFDDASNPAQSVDLVGGNVGSLAGGAAFTADGEGARGGDGDRALDLGTDSNLQRMDVDGSFLNPLGESNALTVSFWQRNNVANGSSFWAVGPGFDRAFQGHTPWGDGNIYFDNSGGCCNDRISGAAPEGHDFTMWNHYAFVKKPNGEKEVWLNGVLAVSGTNPSALPADYTTLFIGSGANGDISVQGAMDDVSIWSRALSAEEIARLAAGEVPTELYDTYETVVLNDRPVAYWRMEDSVVDATGGTAGTNNGITFAEGKIGQAAVFDAAAPGDAYIGFTPGEGGLSQLTNLDEGVTPNANQATSVEFWINTSQVGTADNWRTPLVFGQESPGDGDAQWGYLRADGKIAFSNNDGNHGPHESSVPINDGEWHHVVITYNWATGVSQLYLDGVFDSDFTGGTNRYHDVDGQVRAMGYNPHVDAGAGDASPHLLSQFEGMLDEVAIYDHILSASRVALHYGVGSPGLGQRNYVEIGGGLVDSDGDGVSDILEGVAGTDPENPHDLLRITAMAFTQEGIALEWRAVAGRVYEVEFSENLEPNSWEVIGRYAAEDADDTASFLDTDTDRRAGYYRTRVLQD